MKITPEQIAEGKKICSLATQEGWTFERTSWEDGLFSYELNDKSRFFAIYEREYKTKMKAKFDSDFIAHHNPVFIQSLYAEIEEMRKIIEFYGDKKLWIEEEVHATGFEFASRYDEEQGCSVPVHLEQGQLLGTRFKPRARVIADHGTKAQEYLEGK